MTIRRKEENWKRRQICCLDRRQSVIYMIKNERIKIYPASQEQMEKHIASETDEELKKAYSEMLLCPSRRVGLRQI